MESSHLNLARDHAMAASAATHASDTTVAISEHALAAGEFARAATSTSSVEALRTLRLLEQHHLQLSNILKIGRTSRTDSENTLAPIADEDTEVASGSEHRSNKNETKNDTILAAHPKRVKQNNNIYVPRRAPRNLSSSIASDLASARGIRSSHDRRALSPSVTTRQAPGTLDVPARKGQGGSSGPSPTVGSRPSWLPPVTEASKAEAKVVESKVERSASPAPSSAPTASDEGFARWTTAFGSMLSRLSAPLAFAGLPLTVDDEPNHETKPSPSRPKRRPVSPPRSVHTNEPDVTKIFSKTALASIQYPLDTKPQESFFHVPTTGHTVSYASILNFAEKEKRRNLNASVHSLGLEEDDDFYLAPEHPTTAGPSRSSRKSRTGKSLEVLELENDELRSGLDTLTRRLQSFENAAQSSGLAMQESMRFQRPPSPVSTRSSGSTNQTELQHQVSKLNDQLEEVQKDLQRTKRENEKLTSVVQRYRERWEQLKQGAKTRREAGGKTGGSREASGSEGSAGRVVAS